MVEEGGLCKTSHRAASSEDGTAKAVVRPKVLDENFMYQVVGRVLDHLDLFLNHLAFALNVAFAEDGVLHHVGQDVKGQGQMLIENLRREADKFLRREGVQMSTDRVDRTGNLLLATLMRAFENHVLDEMRNSVELLFFVA